MRNGDQRTSVFMGRLALQRKESKEQFGVYVWEARRGRGMAQSHTHTQHQPVPNVCLGTVQAGAVV